MKNPWLKHAIFSKKLCFEKKITCLSQGFFMNFRLDFYENSCLSTSTQNCVFARFLSPCFFSDLSAHLQAEYFRKKQVKISWKIRDSSMWLFSKNDNFQISDLVKFTMSIFQTFLSSRLRKNFGKMWWQNVYPHSGREGDRRGVLHFYIPQDGNLRSNFWHA